MRCSNGHDNAEGQRFCGECGEALPAATEVAPETETETGVDDTEAAPATRSWRRWVWIGAAVVAVGIVVVVAASGSGSDTADTARRSSGRPQSSVVGNQSTIAPTPTTEAVQHEVKITGNGFTQLPADSIGNAYVSYGVVVENPSVDIAERVSLNVAFYNDAGVVVKAANPSIDVILPGQTAAYGEEVQAAGATRMQVQILVGTWEPTTSTAGAFSAQGVNTEVQTFGGLKTNATLSSSFAKDLKEVIAAAIYYDGNGAIIGGARTFVDFVPAGGQAAVEINSFEDLPAPARTDVFAELSNLSLLGT